MEACLGAWLLALGPARVGLPAAGAGLLLLLLTLADAWPPGAAWSAVALGTGFVVSLYSSGRALEPSTPAFGAGLLLAVELAHLSLELGLPARSDRAPTLRRLGLLAGLALGSAALGYALLPLAAAPLPGGLPATAAGLAAAVGVLALLAWLSRRAV